MKRKKRTIEEVADSMAQNIERLQNHYARLGQLHDTRLFRESDPQTSRLAANAVVGKAGSFRAEFVARLAKMPNGGTAREIASSPSGVDESIRKRASELEKAGVIEVVGVKKCSTSGKMANVYQIKENR